MAHAKKEELQDCVPLLEKIRGMETLKEKSFGCFYRKGKGVLHFHRQGDRRFAHAWDGKKWHEIDLPSGKGNPQNLAAYRRIAEILNAD